jgi:hypothetical protein
VYTVDIMSLKLIVTPINNLETDLRLQPSVMRRSKGPVFGIDMSSTNHTNMSSTNQHPIFFSHLLNEYRHTCQLTRFRQVTPENSTLDPLEVLSPVGCLNVLPFIFFMTLLGISTNPSFGLKSLIFSASLKH